MQTVVIVLACIGIAAGAYAAIKGSASAAGFGVLALGIAVLLPLIV